MERSRAANLPAGGTMVAELLEQVRAIGGNVWLASGELRYRMPQNAAANSTIIRLREAKSDIVSFLQASQIGSGCSLQRSEICSGSAPLAYSQLQHWRLYELNTRAAVRHVAGVRRIQGELHITALRQALVEVIRRQGALRTSFLVNDGEPLQVVGAAAGQEIPFDDLTRLPEDCRLAEARRQIRQTILEPIKITEGPLFAVRLLRIGAADHILLVAMEHIIADMWSLSLFMRDLHSAYSQISSGQQLQLPHPAVQFAAYAARQRAHEDIWLAQHGSYWRDRLAASERVWFPESGDLKRDCKGKGGWDMVSVRLDSALCAQLRQWCRLRHVTLPLAVFAAYAALVLKWCGRSEGVLRFESNGRIAAVANTIGYFTAPLFLRLRLNDQDTFAQWIEQVQHCYYEALEHADGSFMEAQSPRPCFTRNSSFNWVPEACSYVGSISGQVGVAWSDFPFSNPLLDTLERDAEPYILFGQEALSTLTSDVTCSQEALEASGASQEGGLHGAVYFPRSRFSYAYMASFSRNLAAVLGAMLDERGTTLGSLALD